MNMREIRQALSTLADALDFADADLAEYKTKLDEHEETIDELKEEILEWKRLYEELEGAQENV